MTLHNIVEIHKMFRRIEIIPHNIKHVQFECEDTNIAQSELKIYIERGYKCTHVSQASLTITKCAEMAPKHKSTQKMVYSLLECTLDYGRPNK